MTNTVKPTPLPWRDTIGITKYPIVRDDNGLICTMFDQSQESSNYARLIAEAGTVYYETNLTPRQLLEQRDDLKAALFQLYNYALNRGSDDDFPLQISILIRQSYETAIAWGTKGVEDIYDAMLSATRKLDDTP
jgi:hypothetical protein